MGLLEEQVEAISGEFDSEDVSDTLWAYAEMGRMPRKRLMGLLEGRMETISGEFQSQDVSDTLWAYAKMGRKPGERLMGLKAGERLVKASEHHQELESVTRSPVDSREPGDVLSTPLFELPGAPIALSLADCGAPGAPRSTSASFTDGK